MAPFAPLCAFALLAAAPESGTISITTTSPEAAADYVEAFDQLFAGHGDLARAAANRALSRDPNLLLAQALLYAITPGTESMQKVDAAAEAGASLPEAERTELAAWAANKHADAEKGRTLQLKLLELAPRDWRAHVYLGTTEFFAGHKVEEAKKLLSEAATLNPKAMSVWATLAAIAIEQGDRAGAAEAQKKVADMRPDDPAAQADYAYALITAGKLDEAERTARKAAALPNADAKPLAALANVEYYRAQYAQGRKDLAKARSISKDDFERMGFMLFELLGYAAEGKYDGAMQAASALEKEARARKNPNFYVAAAMNRSFAASLLGKYGEGQKYAAEALARAGKEPLSDAGRTGLKRGAWVAALWARASGRRRRKRRRRSPCSRRTRRSRQATRTSSRRRRGAGESSSSFAGTRRARRKRCRSACRRSTSATSTWPSRRRRPATTPAHTRRERHCWPSSARRIRSSSRCNRSC